MSPCRQPFPPPERPICNYRSRQNVGRAFECFSSEQLRVSIFPWSDYQWRGRKGEPSGFKKRGIIGVIMNILAEQFFAKTPPSITMLPHTPPENIRASSRRSEVTSSRAATCSRSWKCFRLRCTARLLTSMPLLHRVKYTFRAATSVTTSPRPM